MLEGPLALVLAYDDVVAPSKAISDFARTSRILTIKGGVLENRSSRLVRSRILRPCRRARSFWASCSE